MKDFLIIHGPVISGNFSIPLRKQSYCVNQILLKTDDLYLRQLNHFSGNQPFSTLQEMESRMIQQALEKNNGNFTAAAEQLGITRQTLYNRIKKADQ